MGGREGGNPLKKGKIVPHINRATCVSLWMCVCEYVCVDACVCLCVCVRMCNIHLNVYSTVQLNHEHTLRNCM